MSNFGQAALTVVGTVVGAYFGNPQLGFLIGSYAGQAAFPTQLPTVRAPRLSDIGQTKATVGSPILKGWGCFPSDGAFIVTGDMLEEIASQKVGGKGGPTQRVEQANYYQSFAIGLNDGEIGGLRRIWANAKLIYDKSPQRADESSGEFNARLSANAALEEIMVVYLGDEEQLPDPTLEAYLGVGNISAFRGLAYVVMTDWPAKDEDGKRAPSQWRFECYTVASVTTTSGTEYANEEFYPWLIGSFPLNDKNAHEFRIAASGYGSAGTDPIEATPISSIGEGLSVMETYRSKPLREFMGCAATPALIGGLQVGVTDTMGGMQAIHSDLQEVLLHYNTFPSTAAPYSPGTPGSPTPPGSTYCARIKAAAFPAKTVLSTDGYTNPTIHTDTGNKVYMPVLPGSSLADYWDSIQFQCDGGDAAEGINLLESAGVSIAVKRVPRAPDNPCTPRAGPVPPRVPGAPGFAFVGGTVTRCGPWAKVTGGGSAYKALRSTVFGPPWSYPLNPVRPTGHADDTEEFWTQAYLAAVARGDMPLGKAYGVHYPTFQNFAYVRILESETVDVSPVSIRPIADYVHQECGYESTEYDSSDLDEVQVIGFVKPAPVEGRGMMEALRAVGFFDVTDSAGYLKYVRRGKAITRTLSRAEMGAHMVGQEAPSEITTTRALISSLPRQLRFHYISYARDYDPGQKDSPVRTEVRAANPFDVETTAVLEDEHAAKLMETLWADIWASRWRHKVMLDTRALADEPTDVLGVPVDGRVERMRIESTDDFLPMVRNYDLVRDDDGAYVSYALGTSVPPVLGPGLSVPAPAEGFLLDIPMLRDIDNDAGFYFAARSYLSDAFRGATLMRSSDSGGNYSNASGSSTAAPTGTLTIPLPSADRGIWDEGNNLVIELNNGELESHTADEVLAGENACVIGAPGRWELIQFRTAENVLENTWKLSGLLRGRRGTDHAIGKSLAGDTFVLLTGGGINRVPTELIQLNRTLLYKTVASGQTLDSATAVPFTAQGVGLRPYSPTFVQGRVNDEGDWVLQWIRRSRIGSAIVSGASIPLAEENEDYEVDIFNESGEVIETISVSTPSATWTAAAQITAFGSEQTTVNLEVFQISAAVGRGYGTRITLNA